MTTFSQMIDEVIDEIKRPDLLDSAISYLNQTIRECHFKPRENGQVFYDANRVEESVTVTNDGAFVWSLPNARRFHALEAIYSRGLGIYIEQKNPRVTRRHSFEPFSQYYWYRAGNDIALSNMGSGDVLDVSYFLYPQRLVYYDMDMRDVVYDSVTDSYVTAVAGVPDSGTPTEADLERVTNWLLERWPDVCLEGIRSKIWRRISDESRARMAYSAFQASLEQMWNTEPNSGGR